MRHAALRKPDQRLGELAYTAYWRAFAPLCIPWARLTTTEKRAWQAAARAITRQLIRTWEQQRRQQAGDGTP